MTLECIKMEFKQFEEDIPGPQRFDSPTTTPLYKKSKLHLDPTPEEPNETIIVDNKEI